MKKQETLNTLRSLLVNEIEASQKFLQELDSFIEHNASFHQVSKPPINKADRYAPHSGFVNPRDLSLLPELLKSPSDKDIVGDETNNTKSEVEKKRYETVLYPRNSISSI